MTEIALITGTSSGMGLHTAVGLARRGLTVVATMRDTERAGRLREAAAAAGVELDVRVLDVTVEASRRAAVAGVLKDYGRIDLLVNNAGQGSVATAEQLDLEEVQHQLEVNYLGPVALTQLVLPGMREAGRGRILTVTSVGGVVGQPFADAYCGAKFAVEGFMQSLAVVAERFDVEVGVVEPAAVASEFVGNVDRAAGSGPYAELMEKYLARSEKAFASAQTAESAAEAIVEAATAEQHRFRWQTSASAEQFVSLSLADADGSRVQGATRTWLD